MNGMIATLALDPPLTPDAAVAPTLTQLVGVLQTTLEPTELLGLFSRHIQSLVPHTGMLYWNETDGLRIQIGREESRRHACPLQVDSENLGIVHFMRQRPFETGERMQLDESSEALLYPLRNALRYRAAVRAAETDCLTGLGNRHRFDNLLDLEIGRARRLQQPLSLIALDLDDFKQINDHFGHLGGDAALRQVGEVLRRLAGDRDLAFRYGGEEFVVLAPGSDLGEARRLAERIRMRLADSPLRLKDRSIRVTASLGVSELLPADNASHLFERADRAVYGAKREGRNRVVCGCLGKA